jgi:hypothetical protein
VLDRGHGIQQVGEGLGARCGLARRINAAEIGQSSEVDAGDVPAIRDQENSAGIFQLMANFALTVAGIEQSRNRSGQRCGVVRGAELPTVPEENGDHFAGLDAIRQQAAGHGLYDVSIFGVRQAASAGSVNQSGLLRIAATGVEHQIMQKKVVRVGVKLRSQHAGRDCTGNSQIRTTASNETALPIASFS